MTQELTITPPLLMIFCRRGGTDTMGTNPELLINMQTRYNMSVALQKKPLLSRLLDIKRVVFINNKRRAPA
ncbi:MAG: hypothetical protein IKQ51_11125 [Bacteroidaceae bacterium]|nr:hypothetical protein [Bacteroidaceae bacterium]